MLMRKRLTGSILLPILIALPASAAKKKRMEPAAKTAPVEKGRGEERHEWSIHAGAALDSQTVKLTSASQVSMNGLSAVVRVSRSGRFSTPGEDGFAATLRWEAGAGIDKFNATASSPACGTNGSCQFDVAALSPFARIGWLASEDLGLQLRAGADLLVPVTSNSNLIDAPALRPLAFATLGILTRLQLSESSSLPIAVDYASFLGSPTVSFSRVIITVGYTWN